MEIVISISIIQDFFFVSCHRLLNTDFSESFNDIYILKCILRKSLQNAIYIKIFNYSKGLLGQFTADPLD